MNYKTSDSIFQKRISFILITKDRQDHLKKYFLKFYAKKQAKFKVISENVINYDPDLLSPESHLWDGGFS